MARAVHCGQAQEAWSEARQVCEGTPHVPLLPLPCVGTDEDLSLLSGAWGLSRCETFTVEILCEFAM